MTASITCPAIIELETINPKLYDFSSLVGVSVAEIYIPLYSVGRTSSPIDICGDYIDAAWASEKLAKTADVAKVEQSYELERHRFKLKLTLTGLKPGFTEALIATINWFQFDDFETEKPDIADMLRNEIHEFEDAIEMYDPLLPEIFDWYFMNLVNGAYYEFESEAPDYLHEELGSNPERRLGFFKSAFSKSLGGSCYTSLDSWIIPQVIDMDCFFAITNQKYNMQEFLPASIVVLDGQSFVFQEQFVVKFPMNQYFKSRMCGAYDISREEERLPCDAFALIDATFTHSPSFEQGRSVLDSIGVAAPIQEKCLLHDSGSLVIVQDGKFSHCLYDTKPLESSSIEKLGIIGLEIFQNFANISTLPTLLSCNWAELDDEEFEQLCYDIIFHHPKFNSQTIRKLGKSRSRDGGRDIQVYEMRNGVGKNPRKWIFQCKLAKPGSSLGATKLQDVGDMLDQYQVEGFGVMTSVLMDATLYDKLDAICEKRSIDQLHFSQLELERALGMRMEIKERYFK